MVGEMEMDWSSIIVSVATAFITGSLALIGTFAANRKSAALMEYRICQLEKKMDKHNQIAERTMELEKRTEVQEERIATANHRIAELERKVG